LHFIVKSTKTQALDSGAAPEILDLKFTCVIFQCIIVRNWHNKNYRHNKNNQSDRGIPPQAEMKLMEFPIKNFQEDLIHEHPVVI
jgi:hypothetical protein